jgi:hypothetical protein
VQIGDPARLERMVRVKDVIAVCEMKRGQVSVSRITIVVNYSAAVLACGYPGVRTANCAANE